jgi:NAD(P)H dehydrogenase (quinone)
MQISLILAHPDQNSFNHAIARCVAREISELKHEVLFHDLYAEVYNPVMSSEEIPSNKTLQHDIESYCREITKCDGIVIVHPNWWGQPPAILTGWIDRVFRPGIAYRFAEGDKGEGVPMGLLKAKFGLVINTSNTSTERETKVFGDPLQLIWKNCIFNLCGVKIFHREVFNIVITSSMDQRKAWLQRSKDLIHQYLKADLRT